MFRKKSSKHLRTGKRGEDLAVWYLRFSGYRIVERNFRCRLGEIDIIARRKSTLVFVEVKTRTSGTIQNPLETVDPVKVFRTVQAARIYLLGLEPPHPPCRFDVIGLVPGAIFPTIRIWHIRDAFNFTSDTFGEGRRRETGKRRRRFEKSGEWIVVKGEWRFRGKEK